MYSNSLTYFKFHAESISENRLLLYAREKKFKKKLYFQFKKLKFG